MSTDRLLDVFVGVNVAPGTIEATENALREATDRIRGMFGSLQNQSVAAAQNAVNAINNAGRSAGGSAAGGGRGGRGSSGGPLARDFEEARRLAQDLQQDLSIVSRIIRSTGAEELTNQLQQMSDFLRSTTTQIGRQRSDGDILGVQESIERLNEFRQRMRELESRGIVVLDLRRQFDDAADIAKRAVTDEKIRNRLAESLIRGTPSGDLRKAILEARNEIEKAEADVRRLTSAFDGTTDQVNALGSAIVRFNNLSSGLADLQKQAKAAGPSFNTLTNNAYQLGQAIEDFSVGYSLNGLTGGIRGAANNVAFLLNNMVQADFIQGRFNEKWKNLLPIIFGAGSGLLIIGPELISWLATLNDIEQKFRDITRSVEKIGTAQGIEANLNRSTESVREFARNASDITDVVKKVLELRSSVVTIETELSGSLREFSKQQVFKDFTDDITALQRKIDEVFKGRGELAKKEVPELLRGLIPERSALDDIVDAQKNTPEVDGLRKSINGVTESLKAVEAESQKGIVSTESLQKAADALESLRDRAKEIKDPASSLAGQLDLASGVADSFEKHVNSLSDAVVELKNKSLEAQRAQKDMADAIIFSQNATARLLEDSRLELLVLQGAAPEAAKLARELQRAGEEQQKRVASIQKLVDAGQLPADVGKQAITNEQENLALENRKTLTEEIISAKDKLKQREEALAALNASSLRDEKARTTTLTQYATDIQANVLSTTGAQDAAEKKRLDAIRKEVLAIQELNDAIAYRNELYNVSTDPEQLRRLSNRRADRFSVEPVGAFKGQDYARAWMEPILRQMVIEQREGTTAVKTKDTVPRAQ